MRIESIELFKVKSFSSKFHIKFAEKNSIYSISGKNGSGKTTILKSAYFMQKIYFCMELGQFDRELTVKEALSFLTDQDSYIKLTLKDVNEVSLILRRAGDTVDLEISGDKSTLENSWNISNPKDLIFFIDATKSSNNETINQSNINITNNEKNQLFLEIIRSPENIFSSIYKQLVRDHLHDRISPSKPPRLIYLRMASLLLKNLMPNITTKNFTSNQSAGEFVLLGGSSNSQLNLTYDIRNFSSGEKTLFSILCFICISNSLSILLIDEPENHFHENLLIEFSNLINTLCQENGFLKWLQEDSNIDKKQLSLVSEYYKDSFIKQTIFSTHSKPLIYKILSLGKNLIVSESMEIEEIDYDTAETTLRSIGLSAVYSRILFVEGNTDQRALDALLAGMNIIIRPLGNCTQVIETFKGISKIHSELSGTKFVFMVDYDNKPESFFEKLRNVSPDFYDSSFIPLKKHEFENYLIDPALLSKVSINLAETADKSTKDFDTIKIKEDVLKIIDSEHHRLLKKQTSLQLQHTIECFFADRIWGSNVFDFKDQPTILNQLTNEIFSEHTLNELRTETNKGVNDIFIKHKNPSVYEKFNYCDGKIVFQKTIELISRKLDINQDFFRRSVLKEAFKTDGKYIISELAEHIKSKFES